MRGAYSAGLDVLPSESLGHLASATDRGCACVQADAWLVRLACLGHTLVVVLVVVKDIGYE